MIYTNKKIEEPPLIFLDNNNEGSPFIADLCSPITYVSTESEVPAVKFLGVYFDPKLNFKYHIQTIKKKMSCALYSLRQVKKNP